MRASVVMTGIASFAVASLGFYYGGWELGGVLAVLGGLITGAVHCGSVSTDTSRRPY